VEALEEASEGGLDLVDEDAVDEVQEQEVEADVCREAEGKEQRPRNNRGRGIKKMMGQRIR
jgi:hypothetical protein